jgi:hypothetical protein
VIVAVAVPASPASSESEAVTLQVQTSPATATPEGTVSPGWLVVVLSVKAAPSRVQVTEYRSSSPSPSVAGSTTRHWKALPEMGELGSISTTGAEGARLPTSNKADSAVVLPPSESVAVTTTCTVSPLSKNSSAAEALDAAGDEASFTSHSNLIGQHVAVRVGAADERGEHGVRGHRRGGEGDRDGRQAVADGGLGGGRGAVLGAVVGGHGDRPDLAPGDAVAGHGLRGEVGLGGAV